MKNPPLEIDPPPAEPLLPRAIPDVDVATPEPDLWGGEGPTEPPKKPKDRD